ncbi:MAG: STAS domain-containing protein [Aquihabitans sp.]
MSLMVRSAPFSITISRALGTVVVTVHGDLDEVGARHLGTVLVEIIDGQGNLAVVVDLHDATALDGSGLSVFVTAAAQASRRGASFTLSNLPGVLSKALTLRGLGGRLGTDRHGGRRISPSAPFGRIAALTGRECHPAGGTRLDVEIDEGPR